MKTILHFQRGSSLWITLNRPRVANRVNRRMAEELAEVAAEVNQDETIRVVLLTGRGKAFSTGWERVRSFEALRTLQAAAAIARIEKPVIAVINGDATGQGLELALATDLRIAVKGALFGLPQVAHGMIPWDGATQRLPRLIGRGSAMWLLLTGELIDAEEAQRLGLISHAVEPARLGEVAEEVATQVARAAPIAAQYAKEAIAKGMDMSLEQGMRLEADLSILLHTTRDRVEGIRSFLERRPPRFRGK